MMMLRGSVIFNVMFHHAIRQKEDFSMGRKASSKLPYLLFPWCSDFHAKWQINLFKTFFQRITFICCMFLSHDLISKLIHCKSPFTYFNISLRKNSTSWILNVEIQWKNVLFLKGLFSGTFDPRDTLPIG